ncbi:MAG: Uma2 family endonuclease [Deltaproteobacteria bacterium]|nr:MAG: Uma2 family endonuclease [Deltaproteobacteria bacterium]
MASIAPAATRFTSEEYFALIDQGTLRPDDRVELLEGVIVAMAPENPRHAVATEKTAEALRGAVGGRAAIRVQHALHLGAHSVPEADVAVVRRHDDYVRAHPRTAVLVVEVADTSLIQDRLSKAAIYAAAGIPEYWIINLRDDRVEMFRAPDRGAARYAETRLLARGERVELAQLPGATIAVDALLPGG